MKQATDKYGASQNQAKQPSKATNETTHMISRLSKATRETRARSNSYQQIRKTTSTLLCWYTVPEHLPKDELKATK
jgi:hypothetical protein